MTEVHELAALYVVDALTRDESEDFETHLADCVACQGEVAEMRSVTEHLSRTVEVEPPASLRANVLAGITRTPQDAPLPTRREQIGDNVVAFPQRSSPKSRLPYLVAAAALVIAVGFGGWGLQSHQDAQQASGQQAELVQLLGSADVHTVTGPGPSGSSGTVVISRQSHQAVFVANKMPALSGNKVYELWTIKATPVPAGTFTSNGAASLVDLPAAALSAGSIAVTVEPAGGSRQPTTQPIMALTVS